MKRVKMQPSQKSLRQSCFEQTGAVLLRQTIMGLSVLAALGCSPQGRQGNGLQQAAQSKIEFTWAGYRFAAVPDTTPVATAAEWASARDKIRFFVKKEEVKMSKLQAQHPSRTFRNMNGGPVTLDKENNVTANPQTGKPADGNAPSKQGQIQGIVVVGADGSAVGLDHWCFDENYIGNMKEICVGAAGERLLQPPRQEGNDYYFRTTSGKLIAKATAQFVTTDALTNWQDRTEEIEVSAVELGPGVEIWGGRLVDGPLRSADIGPGCSNIETKSESGVFTAVPPADYTGNEQFVHDALSKAACSLAGKSMILQPRCLQYFGAMPGAETGSMASEPDRFCTRAEVYDFAAQDQLNNQSGGFGIWLVVKETAGDVAVQPTVGTQAAQGAQAGAAVQTQDAAGAAKVVAAVEQAATEPSGLCAKSYQANETLLSDLDKKFCAERPYSKETLNDNVKLGYTTSFSAAKRDACLAIYCAAASK